VNCGSTTRYRATGANWRLGASAAGPLAQQPATTGGETVSFAVMATVRMRMVFRAEMQAGRNPT